MATVDRTNFFSTLSAYILSFFFIASFWISHHTIINPVQTVDKKLLWTNILLLLPISLLPLVTSWHGEFPQAVAPSVCYSLIYVLSVLGLYVLGQISLKRVADTNRHKCYLINKTRFHLVIFGLLSTVLTFLILLISSVAVFAILIYWLISSTIRDK